MKTLINSLIIALATVLPAQAEAESAWSATLEWMEKVSAEPEHNAFTDLIRWRDQYFLCFRHGESHNSMDGVIRIMRSPDMRNWESCGTLKTMGDDRDPHFVATENTLHVYFGTWDLVHPTGHGATDRGSIRSHFSSTTDGKEWSKVQGVYEPGWWLWRVRWNDGKFYTAAYTAVRPKPDVRETRLLSSEDGLNWTLISAVTNERLAGEADMRFRADGSMWLVSRTGDEAGDAAWFDSEFPYREWKRRDTGVLIHSPVIEKWKDRTFIAGRGKQEGASVTKIWEIVDGQFEELLVLPSGGDTAYPGLVADPASLDGDTPALFVSWYSQHENEGREGADKMASSVYVGRAIVGD
jgi:hypothetical protein